MKSIWAWMVHNVLIVGGFIILAIHFNHWWIVLFSLLFFANKYEEKNKNNKEDNIGMENKE